MDARGIMEPVDQPQPMSRQEQRHQRKELKKAMKPNKNDLSQKCKTSKNIAIKIINDYFKPKTERIFKKKHESVRHYFRRKINYSNDYNKTASSNNNLGYYFPNLFNMNNNKILSPEKHINKSNTPVVNIPCSKTSL